MLIRFKVKNFLSFNCKEDDTSEEFSMIAGKVRNKEDHVYSDGTVKLLKFSALYGANASGKSNFVKALHFMQHTITQKLPSRCAEFYCKSDPENKNKPTYFEVEMKIGQKYYAYGFEILLNTGEFISEWLVELKKNTEEKEIFTRDISKGIFQLGKYFKSPDLTERLNLYSEDIQEDNTILFLKVMNQNKNTLYKKYKTASIFKNVYDWFQNQLSINYPDRPVSDYSYMMRTENIDELCKIISSFGTGISDFKLVDIDENRVMNELPRKLVHNILTEIEEKTRQIKREKKIDAGSIMIRTPRNIYSIEIDDNGIQKYQTINFTHENNRTLFSLSEESDGTIRLLDLLEILFTKEEKTYVIDELDRCLHPNLTYQFVKTYLKYASSKNIQLIVTTHESRLMDFDLLRRDEIWFTNKNNSGESNIYSLEEYNARFDQKIDKAYLEGRYGGVPIFTSVFPIK